MFEKLWTAVKANKEMIIKKGLVIAGVVVSGVIVATLVPNEDPEMTVVEAPVATEDNPETSV